MMAGTKRQSSLLDSWVVSSSKRPAVEVEHAAESEATNEGSDIMQGTTSESESRQEPGQSSESSSTSHQDSHLSDSVSSDSSVWSCDGICCSDDLKPFQPTQTKQF